MKTKHITEAVMHGIFFACGMLAIAFVALISLYILTAGLPAIGQIGLGEFLLGTVWQSTAAEPKFGILPFILTSIWGTLGAILIGVPVGVLTAVFLSKVASPRLAGIVRPAVDLLAGIPSVVYGLVGMMGPVPPMMQGFHLSNGTRLLAALRGLALQVLPRPAHRQHVRQTGQTPGGDVPLQTVVPAQLVDGPEVPLRQALVDGDHRLLRPPGRPGRRHPAGHRPDAGSVCLRHPV